MLGYVRSRSDNGQAHVPVFGGQVIVELAPWGPRVRIVELQDEPLPAREGLTALADKLRQISQEALRQGNLVFKLRCALSLRVSYCRDINLRGR